MTRSLSSSVALLCALLAAHADAAEPGDSTTSAETNPTTSDHVAQDFDALKKAGDRALADGRLNDATKAYASALNVRRDPLVSGRLGLVLMMWEDPKLWLLAARVLHDAVIAAAGTSQAERRQFFEAYTRVRRHVCRLEVTTSDVNVVVSVGNGKTITSEGAFWTFVDKGAFELVAHLDGHDDIRKPYECKQGEDLAVDVVFAAPDKPAPEVITIVESTEPKTVIVREFVSPKPEPTSSDKPWRFVVGASAFFGAAPSPAVGVTGIASYRWSLRTPWAISVDAGALAGWTPVEIRDAISASAFLAHGALCAHYRIAFGCPTFTAGAIRYSFVTADFPANEPTEKFTYGGGLRIGAEYFWGSAIGVRAYGDLLKLGDRNGISIQRYGLVWSGPEFAGTLMLGVVGKL